MSQARESAFCRQEFQRATGAGSCDGALAPFAWRPCRPAKLTVYARPQLVDRPPQPDQPALLLEGSWPIGDSPSAGRSLDEAIDSRFEWVDRQAADWAERLAQASPPRDDLAPPPEAISAAYLDALALRYYLAKLIRVVAYFDEVQRLASGDCVALVAARGRDEDYAELIEGICRAAGADLQIRWSEAGAPGAAGFPPNSRWRRLAARLAEMIQPPVDSRAWQRRAVLCGNPRFLNPVCRELLARKVRVWWLYDRFAFGSWLRWRATGVGQMVCNASLGIQNRLVADLPERVDCRGVDLAPPLRRWMARRLQARGPRQTRVLEQIDAHFRRVRPQFLVLDEDATPLARAAVAVARHAGASSFVVQHGAPCCRFGFAPLAADRILVWGRSSQRQLIRWEVAAERTVVTGSPRHHRLAGKLGRGTARKTRQPPRILLLATVAPSDGRPDAVALNLNRRTYAEMLRTACAAVRRLAGARLIVKLHPRAPHDPIARATLGDFPLLDSRVACRGPLEKWLKKADCVLSCMSSAGVEAALTGMPVIQLLPAGCADILPHDEWGMTATARNEAELDRLLNDLAGRGWRTAGSPASDALASVGRQAARRIADAVLASGFGDRSCCQRRSASPAQRVATTSGSVQPGREATGACKE